MQLLDEKTRATIIDRIDFALRFKVQPRLRWNDDGGSRRAAAAILDYLLLANTELRRGLPLRLHGNPSAKDSGDTRAGSDSATSPSAEFAPSR